jgi:hypothetical protein
MNNYGNLVCIQARSPEKLVEQLKAIPVPSSIMEGSWFTQGLTHGVWVVLDRSVDVVSKKAMQGTKQDSKQKNN